MKFLHTNVNLHPCWVWTIYGVKRGSPTLLVNAIEKFTPFFMLKSDNIHIGKIIKQTLDSRGQSYSWLARQLYTDVSNVPKILKRKSLNTDLLLRISLILHKDFFAYYSDFYAANNQDGTLTPAKSHKYLDKMSK